jgi:hypothetical protein
MAEMTAVITAEVCQGVIKGNEKARASWFAQAWLDQEAQIVELREENERLRAELELNAKMVSRQREIARETEHGLSFRHKEALREGQWA